MALRCHSCLFALLDSYLRPPDSLLLLHGWRCLGGSLFFVLPRRSADFLIRKSRIGRRYCYECYYDSIIESSWLVFAMDPSFLVKESDGLFFLHLCYSSFEQYLLLYGYFLGCCFQERYYNYHISYSRLMDSRD